ncbi:uncharacterized protein [Dermacentor andersoni]|uniref:uncharacterized protein n=1 Tax=Dermacentor andersoni TaxID=34620 RepID=UPI00215536CD|nr:uncharacterized protein LOC126548320 [Dermacentor andersoni]
MSSDSSASRSSSQVNLSTEMGGRRVEVNAVRTGSQQQQAGSSQSAGIKTTISHAYTDYSIGAPTPRANLFVPNSPYALYDPYNPYSPYNPYNPYIVYAPRAPCPKHGHQQAPTPAASPQPSGASVPAEPASEGTSLAGPAAPPVPLKFEMNGRQVIVKDGFDIEEEYINDRLVSRTVNGVREPVPQKK